MYLEPLLQFLMILSCAFVILGTIHLRRRQTFHDFLPLAPTVGSFLQLSVSKFGNFLTPTPLKNANVLDGWSLMSNIDKIAVEP